ncbi:bolA-like protein 3 [Planococcus citri]|uniref:bolA-like protein 3 n=1 Tax=Planococcus citri TaxID=170843 RepID=UPI0031F9EBDD
MYLSRLRPFFSATRQTVRRSCSASNNEKRDYSEHEKKVFDILQNRFTSAKSIRVVDVSCGCGAMFDVTVVSPEFKGMAMVKQHQMVTEALKDEIKKMHGIRISTDHEVNAEN